MLIEPSLHNLFGDRRRVVATAAAVFNQDNYSNFRVIYRCVADKPGMIVLQPIDQAIERRWIDFESLNDIGARPLCRLRCARLARHRDIDGLR